ECIRGITTRSADEVAGYARNVRAMSYNDAEERCQASAAKVAWVPQPYRREAAALQQAVLADRRFFERKRRAVTKPHLARFESLSSPASVWVKMICRASKRGCNLSKERARSEAATTCAGSPTRRPANSTLKSTPQTCFTVLITSSTEKPRP